MDLTRNGISLNCLLITFSFIFILFLLSFNVNNITSAYEEEEFPVQTVSVYKCKESKLAFGLEISVPSYTFNSKVILRINDNHKPFPGCDSSSSSSSKTTKDKTKKELVETELFYIAGDQPYLDFNESLEIERNAISINPSGVLNVQDHFYNLDEYCVLDYKRAKTPEDKPSLKLKYCPANCSTIYGGKDGGDICIKKCCPVGQVLDLEAGCRPSGNKTWTGFFYDENTWKPIDKNKKTPHFYRQPIAITCNGSEPEEWMMRKLGNNSAELTRLLTNGELLFISPQRKWKVIDTEGKFCIDGIQNYGESPYYSGLEIDQVVVMCGEPAVPQDINLSKLYMVCLFVSAFFYLLTAIIYALLWNKQNTNGWVVFSVVISQLFMSIFIGHAHLRGLLKLPNTRNSFVCVANAILAHFFQLAAFAWIAVINFDLWSTFRALRPRNNKNIEWKKFSLYSLVGWGTPTVVVIVGIILDSMFPDRESLVLVPEYGVQFCYIAPWAQGPYVYYIMAFLLVFIVTLSILTCSKIYQFNKDTAGARKSSSAEDRKIFRLYAKLSVVLGTSWVFEFISWASSSKDHQHWIWVIFDLYNCLTAVFIFIIFGCKRTNFTQLMEKYSCLTCLKPLDDVFTKFIAGIQTSDATASSVISPQSGTNGHEMKQYGSNSNSSDGGGGVDSKSFESSTTDVRPQPQR